MKKTMITVTVLSTAFSAVCLILYHFYPSGPILSLCITFCTVTYHFAMRLIVGISVNAVMKNRADLSRRWFRQHEFEKKLYSFLRVRKWKQHMPSYDPTLFSVKEHSLQEILQAMCQAEIVHEIIAVLSFVPLFAAIPFGEFWVFLITSVLSACFDLLFVIMQRYNRPRLLRIAMRETNK